MTQFEIKKEVCFSWLLTYHLLECSKLAFSATLLPSTPSLVLGEKKFTLNNINRDRDILL